MAKRWGRAAKRVSGSNLYRRAIVFPACHENIFGSGLPASARCAPVPRLDAFARPEYSIMQSERTTTRTPRKDSPTNMAGVTLQHLQKSFADPITKKTVHAVNDLNLEIRDGEFLVLVGPSGCGKTTALRIDRRAGRADRRRDQDRRADGSTMCPRVTEISRWSSSPTRCIPT